MKRFLLGFVSVLVTMLVVESVWFATVVDRVYRPELGDLLAADVRVLPAILFYLSYPIAVVILAIRPHDAVQKPLLAAGRGVVLGLAAYGAYELTNLATLAGWWHGTDSDWGLCR